MIEEKMYTIHHKGISKDGKSQSDFDIQIGILPVEQLILHEKTRDHSLKKLIAKIDGTDSVWNPIIVDKKTRVILDGMHRTTACMALGYKFMGVALIDAMSTSVGLGKWNRSFYGGNVPAEVIPAIEKLGISLQDIPYKECNNWAGYWDDLMRSEGAHGVLVDVRSNKSYLLSAEEKSAKDQYDTVQEIEVALTGIGYRYHSICDKNLLDETDNEDTEFLFVPPPLSKQDIFDTCTKGAVFSPKASCFFLPVRPMFVDFPVSLLKENSEEINENTIDEICSQRNADLKKLLESKKLTKIRGNVTLDRFYQEDYLYLFDAEKRPDVFKDIKDHMME
jgi:L-serine kinase (ADP)